MHTSHTNGRAATLIGGVLATMIACAALALAAPSANACPANHACGYANANYTPANYYWDPNGLSDGQFLGWFGTPACPGGNWNDCISSLINNGRFTECYSMDFNGTGPAGPIYTNAAYTSASYVGNYWNDTFSYWYYTWTGHC